MAPNFFPRYRFHFLRTADPLSVRLILLNVCKIPFVMVGLDHHLFTLLQTIDLGMLSANSKVSKLGFARQPVAIFSVLYFVSIVLVDVFAVLFLSQPFLSLVPALVYSSSPIIFSLLCCVDPANKYSSYKCFENTMFLSVAYLALTIAISFLQNPSFSTLGQSFPALNSLVSGNHLGFFRSNGGFGGTVVDYAVFLGNTSFLLFPLALLKRRLWLTLLLLLLLSGSYLCFSRVFFAALSLSMLYLSFIYIYRKSRFLSVISVVIFFITAILAVDGIISYLLGLSSEISGLSDTGRASRWLFLLDFESPLSFLFGNGFLVNTAFKGLGELVSGDGFFVSIVAQTGVIGLLLLLIGLVFLLRQAKMPLSMCLLFFLMFVLMALANSGFFKIFNLFAYFNSLWICSFVCQHVRRTPVIL